MQFKGLLQELHDKRGGRRWRSWSDLWSMNRRRNRRSRDYADFGRGERGRSEEKVSTATRALQEETSLFSLDESIAFAK